FRFFDIFPAVYPTGMVVAHSEVRFPVVVPPTTFLLNVDDFAKRNMDAKLLLLLDVRDIQGRINQLFGACCDNNTFSTMCRQPLAADDDTALTTPLFCHTSFPG